jgi:hypothetical protein
MVFTLTITEFVKKFQLCQLPAMLAFSLTAQKDVSLVQLDVDHAQALLFVPFALKMGSASLMEPAEPFVVMELLLELNNVMTKTLLQMTDAQLHAQLNHCGLALVNHQFVPTMAPLFVETEELKEGRNAMMEIL